MKNFFKKNGLGIQLTPIFIVVVIVSIALIMKAIDLPTSISIFAVLIAITILLISISEIRNRLRPWVAVNTIDIETTNNPAKFYSHFSIRNTGPIPARRMQYTTRWYLQNNGDWKEIEIPEESPFTSALQMLFPNQNIVHRTEMEDIRSATGDKDTKVTFVIEYHGLWAKYTTTNTHRFIYARKVWAPDEPQDYT